MIFILVLIPITFIAILFALVRLEYFDELPDVRELEQVSHRKPNILLDRNGKIIDEISTGSYIKFENISDELVTFLINTEDRRFYEHRGIDYYALVRVLFKSILMNNSSSGGGSTITQQLAKNLYPRNPYPYLYYPINKLREMLIARRIENLYGKDEILEFYLNSVPFGSNATGIGDASLKFFNKKPSELTLEESATLAGVLKATTTYSPFLHPERSKERRNLVIQLAIENEVLTGLDSDSLRNLPLKTSPPAGINPLRGYISSEIVSRTRNILERQGFTNHWHAGGLKIQTSIDLGLQETSEKRFKAEISRLQKNFDNQISEKLWARNREIINRKSKGLSSDNYRELEVFTHEGTQSFSYSSLDSLKHYLKFLHAGLLSADPRSGGIRVWVGGIDHRYFPYDHAGENAKRQVGSVIKPFLYATALEKGISPCKEYDATRTTYTVDGREWSPGNADDLQEGEFALEEALSKSINTVAVKLLNEVGIKEFIGTLKRGGIESTIPPVPSIALGTPEISLYEMVQAYTAFANHGVRKSLYLVEEIQDSDEKVLYSNSGTESKRMISEKSAVIMMQMLKKVVESGTASTLLSGYGITGETGGKTGTTQNGSDGWFIGITPVLVSGAWVGGEYPGIRFESAASGQGARTALPIVGAHLNSAYRIGFDGIRHAEFGYNYHEYKRETNCDPFLGEFTFFRNIIERLKGKKRERQEEESAGETKKWGEEKEQEKSGFFKKLKKIFTRKE